jgi:hypothetical protein
VEFLSMMQPGSFRRHGVACATYLAVATLSLVATPGTADADWDLSLFLGRAYPTFEDRFVIRLPSPSPVPGLDIQPRGIPELRADGGAVFGGALAWEAGVFGIEGRLDVTDVELKFTGARYDLEFNPPIAGVSSGNVTLADARIEVDRLRLWSLNVRLRTPGSVSVFASGGLSYLPAFEITGDIPVTFQLGGLQGLTQPRLVLGVAPGQSSHRFGVNGGAGLRMAGRVGVFAEARVFYFENYELSVLPDAPLIEDVFNIDPVRFEPVIVNAAVGLIFRF